MNNGQIFTAMLRSSFDSAFFAETYGENLQDAKNNLKRKWPKSEVVAIVPKTDVSWVPKIEVCSQCGQSIPCKS